MTCTQTERERESRGETEKDAAVAPQADREAQTNIPKQKKAVSFGFPC